MKKILAMMLAVVMVFALCACGQKAAPAAAPAAEAPAAAPAAEAPAAEAAPAAEPVVLRFAFSEAPESITAQIMDNVKTEIETKTEGRVVVENYYANALGSIADCIEQMALGGNLVCSTSAGSWAPYGCEDLTALDMMFAFSNTDEIQNFNKSDMWKNMVAELEQNGNIHMICMNWAAAPRVVLANKPINSVDDLKGLLIRVPTNVYTAWFDALGAAPVSGIPFAEVYQNIENGVIEAAEAPFATLSDFSVQEVAKYAFTSCHTYAAAVFGCNVDVWNLISAEDQAVITDVLTAGGVEYTKINAEKNGEFIQAFKDAGVTVVEPSDADKEAFAAAAIVAGKTLEVREGVLDEIKAASQG